MPHAKSSLPQRAAPNSQSRLAARGVRTADPVFATTFEQLYQAHCSPLRRTAFHWVGNVHDAEDAVQEAFLRAYRGAASFAGESALSTWLYRILMNICHDLRRQRKRRPEPQELGSESEPRARQPVVTEDHPLRLSLERTLRRLNPRHSIVLLTFEVEGLKHSEIAAVLRISEGASKTRLSQARRALREMLAPRVFTKLNRVEVRVSSPS